MNLTGFLSRTANSLVASGSGVPPWLGDHDNPFIYTLHLRGVSDPLDGDALWEHEYGGGADIREAKTGRDDRRLRLALDAHRQIMLSHDPERGHSVEDPRVFSDVLVRIPHRLWKARRMTGGSSIALLLDKLAYRHNREFQDHLFGDRPSRYQVVPDEGLGEDEVLCQFGLGVFIPDAQDRLRGELQIALDGRELPLPEWESYLIGRGPLKRITRAAAVYHDQHYLLLADDHLQSAVRSPLWPPGSGGWLVLDLSGETPVVEAEESQLQPLEVQPGPQPDSWICRVGSRVGDPGRNLELQLSLQPAPKPKAEPEGGTEKQQPPATDKPRGSGTIVFTGRRTGPRLLLDAIALPRIDPQLAPGLAAWTLRLDRDGSVAAAAGDGATLKGRSGDQGVVQLQAAGAKGYRPLHPPVKEIDAGNGCAPLRIDAPPGPDYLGLLRLSSPKEYLIPAAGSGSTLIGRRPDAENAIALGLLAQPEGLLWDDNSARGSLNDLVSARFAELEVRDDGLHVKLLSRNSPLYLLNQEGRMVDNLRPGSTEELLVAPGGQLLLGLYLLRYQPEE